MSEKKRQEGRELLVMTGATDRIPACVAIRSLWEAGGSYKVQLKQAMGQVFQGA